MLADTRAASTAQHHAVHYTAVLARAPSYVTNRAWMVSVAHLHRLDIHLTLGYHGELAV